MPHQCTNCGRAFEDGSKEMLSGCPDCGGNKFQFLPASAMDDAAAGGGAGETPAGASATSVGGTAAKKTPESGTGARAGASRDASATDPSAEDRSAVDRAAATVRDWVGRRDDDDATEQRPTPEVDSGDGDAVAPDDPDGLSTSGPAVEDSAQADARTDVVNPDELPDEAPTTPPTADDGPESGSDTDVPAPGAADEAAEADDMPADGPPADGEVAGRPDVETPGLEELREELNSQFESIRIVEPGQYELNLMELYEREEYVIALREDGKYVIEVPDAWEQLET